MSFSKPVYMAAAVFLASALAGCGGASDSSSGAAKQGAKAAESEAPAAASESSVEKSLDNAVADIKAAAADAAESTAAGVEAAKVAAAETADKTANVMNNAASAAGAAVETAMAGANEAVTAAAGAVVAAAASAATDLVGDPAKGKRVFVKCMSCHTVVAGQNRVGPSLYGIVGRKAGTIAGFAYSDANKNSGITWTEDIMFAYLENPQGYIPGTKMVFPGLPSAQDRVDVIAYLKSEVK